MKDFHLGRHYNYLERNIMLVGFEFIELLHFFAYVFLLLIYFILLYDNVFM